MAFCDTLKNAKNKVKKGGKKSKSDKKSPIFDAKNLRKK